MDYSQIHMKMSPDQVHGFDINAAIKKGQDCTVGFMHDIGVTFDEADENVQAMMKIAQDSAVAVGDAAEPQTGNSIAAGIQFLQHFLPKTVKVVTEKRTIDAFIGKTIAGEWHDEEIVQPVVESTGSVREYSDDADFMLAGFKTGYLKRTIVRFEGGVQTGKLEEMRVAAMKMRISAYDAKRAALGDAFAINTNDIGFNGWNSGANMTFGILNDPFLADYIEVAPATSGGTDTEWSNKDYQAIVKDLNTAAAQLRKQSGYHFDPMSDAFTLGIAADCVDWLNNKNLYGNQSVRQWIKETWPKCRIVGVPQLAAAHGGENAFYMILDSLGGNSVVDQYVVTAMRLLGTEKKAKGIREDYTNATAGVLVSQPTGIVRYFGI